MCDFCDREDCKLTKEEVIQRGAIIESNVEGPMRSATKDAPMTIFSLAYLHITVIARYYLMKMKKTHMRISDML